MQYTSLEHAQVNVPFEHMSNAVVACCVSTYNRDGNKMVTNHRMVCVSLVYDGFHAPCCKSEPDLRLRRRECSYELWTFYFMTGLQ